MKNLECNRCILKDAIVFSFSWRADRHALSPSERGSAKGAKFGLETKADQKPLHGGGRVELPMALMRTGGIPVNGIPVVRPMHDRRGQVARGCATARTPPVRGPCRRFLDSGGRGRTGPPEAKAMAAAVRAPTNIDTFARYRRRLGSQVAETSKVSKSPHQCPVRLGKIEV